MYFSKIYGFHFPGSVMLTIKWNFLLLSILICFQSNCRPTGQYCKFLWVLAVWEGELWWGMYCREKFISYIPFVVCLFSSNVAFFSVSGCSRELVLLEEFWLLASFLFTFCSLCRHRNIGSFYNIRWRGTV